MLVLTFFVKTDHHNYCLRISLNITINRRLWKAFNKNFSKSKISLLVVDQVTLG